MNAENATPLKWFFENTDDEELGIETAEYENGNRVKRKQLSNGLYAIARELTGKDMKQVDRICNGVKEEYMPALMITAVKIEDKEGNQSNITMEELDDMKGKDFTSIKMIATMLNF